MSIFSGARDLLDITGAETPFPADLEAREAEFDDESCGESLGAATDERLILQGLALGNVSVAPQDEPDAVVRRIGAMTPREARECLDRLAVGGTLSTFPRRRRRHWLKIADAVLSVAGVAGAVAVIIVDLVW